MVSGKLILTLANSKLPEDTSPNGFLACNAGAIAPVNCTSQSVHLVLVDANGEESFSKFCVVLCFGRFITGNLHAHCTVFSNKAV